MLGEDLPLGEFYIRQVRPQCRSCLLLNGLAFQYLSNTAREKNDGKAFQFGIPIASHAERASRDTQLTCQPLMQCFPYVELAAAEIGKESIMQNLHNPGSPDMNSIAKMWASRISLIVFLPLEPHLFYDESS